MTERTSYWTPKRVAIVVAVAAAIVWLIFRGSTLLATVASRLTHVLITLLLAAAVAYIVWPAVIAFERALVFLPARVRRVLSALVVVLGFVAGLCVLIVFTAVPVVTELKGLSIQLKQWLLQLPDLIDRLGAISGRYLPAETIDAIRERAIEYTTSLFAAPTDIFKRVVVKGWYIVELFIVPVLAFYFVCDGAELAEQFISRLPPGKRERAWAMGQELNMLMHSYIRAQLLMCFIMALATSLLLYAAGIRVYLTLGLIAGIGWAIPILGPVIVGIPIVLICLIQKGLQTALVVLIGYSIINIVQSKIIMPNVLSAGARLHPALVIVALLIGAEFMGVLGMFIAVPAAAAIRVLVRHYWPVPQASEEAE